VIPATSRVSLQHIEDPDYRLKRGEPLTVRRDLPIPQRRQFRTLDDPWLPLNRIIRLRVRRRDLVLVGGVLDHVVRPSGCLGVRQGLGQAEESGEAHVLDTSVDALDAGGVDGGAALSVSSN